MLSMTLTFEPMTLKCHQCHVGLVVSVVISFIEICQCTAERDEKIPPKVLILPHVAVILIFDLSTAKYNQLIFLSPTEVVNLVKFSRAIYKILC